MQGCSNMAGLERIKIQLSSIKEKRGKNRGFIVVFGDADAPTGSDNIPIVRFPEYCKKFL